MSRGFERHWQELTPLSLALYPFSLLFRAIVAVRRAAYTSTRRRREKLPVPVVVIGNITVGGTGKTPLVAWLARFLASHGLKPGIVSRGYGVQGAAPRAVTSTSDPARCGDEPVLLAQRTGVPVWIGADRVATARALLAAHPSRDVILSDDGLQHYRLARNCEIAVIDGERALGNRLLLPAGPLREPPSRLSSVDAVVVNGCADIDVVARNLFTMTLVGQQFRNLLNPRYVVGADYFQHKRVHAIAGIGNPARFFAHLSALGLTFDATPFRDHHAYTPRDIEFSDADAIVMTEKDAVKCAAFASERHWVLPVDAVPDPELGALVMRRLSS